MKKRDVLGDLESKNAECLNAMRMLALKLSFLTKASILTASAIADGHARAAERALAATLAREHAPRRKARKGTRGHRPR